MESSFDGTTGGADGRNRREGERLPLVLNAQCLIGFDHSSEVWLIDVSRDGCRLFACAGLLKSGQEIVLVRNGDQRHYGRVVWAAGMKAGIRFAASIPEEELEHLLALAPDISMSAGSADSRLVDGFGRELAPLPALVKRQTRR